MCAHLLRPAPTRGRGGGPAWDAPIPPSERRRQQERPDDALVAITTAVDDQEEPQELELRAAIPSTRPDDMLFQVLRAKQAYLKHTTEFLHWCQRDAPRALQTEMYVVLYRTETRGAQFRMHSPEFVWVPMKLEVVHDEYGMLLMAAMVPPADALVALPMPDDRHRQLLDGESMVATLVCGTGDDDSYVLFYGQMPAPASEHHARSADLVSESHFCCPTSDGATVVLRPVGRASTIGGTRVAFAVHEVQLGMHSLFTSNRAPRWPTVLAYAYLQKYPKGEARELARRVLQDYKRVRDGVSALDASHMTLDAMEFGRRRFATPFQEARVGASPDRARGRAQPESELSRPSEVARGSCIVS